MPAEGFLNLYRIPGYFCECRTPLYRKPDGDAFRAHHLLVLGAFWRHATYQREQGYCYPLGIYSVLRGPLHVLADLLRGLAVKQSTATNLRRSGNSLSEYLEEVALHFLNHKYTKLVSLWTPILQVCKHSFAASTMSPTQDESFSSLVAKWRRQWR